jgi:ATP/maltotriose-dependent transcriptional regulator MalT
VETTPTVGVGRRRIIKRPRLTRMLDESGARIILLVAPAGYGKTTLAHEWLDPRQAAWYRGSPASADVAALALGIASAAAQIVPGAGERMRERLRATDRPDEDAPILADMLIEDLRNWPVDAWLVVDDYHFAMDSVAPERFVGALANDGSPPLFITSRRRPGWASARSRLYGKILEVDRTMLTMTPGEGLCVLGDRVDATDLIDQADGWPAVIGIAALASGSSPPVNDVPAELYDYFAEELLQDAPAQARLGLCRLAVAPSITNQAAAHLLGRSAGRVLRKAVDAGILQPQSEGQFELNPLLRTFLQERLGEFDPEMVTSTVRDFGAFLVDHGDWDDALTLVEEFRNPELLDKLLGAAWESMLDQGRQATLSRLVDLASELRLRSGLLDLVEAEIAFRQASYRKAEALALEASHRLSDNHLLVRAYTRAGQSAHFDNRDLEALDHHRRAHAIAQSTPDRRESIWGEFACSIQLEGNDCVAALNRLMDLGTDDARDQVRIANGQMLLAIRTGAAIDPRLLSAVYRLPRVDDPLIRSSFRHVWCCVLTLTGRYQEALEATQQQFDEAAEYRLAFVLPHAHIRHSLALRGLRRFREALNHLADAQHDRDSSDDHIAISAESARIGVHLATGDFDAAVDILEPYPAQVGAADAVVAEFVATRALALACSGDLDAARESARRAISLSSAAEPLLLAKLATVVADLQESLEVADRVAEVFHDVVRSGNADAFVTAYRGFPGLIEEVARTGETHARLRSILAAANDMKLAERTLSRPLSPKASPLASVLTAREREVLELIAKGLRNREIAQELFISEVTVKAHVRNIMQKLGARSRTHAVSLAHLVD